ncbi:UNVERIFIED_CONTAM: hypothetical protein GTU68_065527 [Idotea baltica]|nr:hypothetical protein [Idotea baltica]
MTRLSVNVNKLALLRNARGENQPNLSEWVAKIESYGAQGITVHPRPDERHVTRKDVYTLKKIVNTEFNIEGFPSTDFIELIQDIKPEQVTLVPDPPRVLTSNTGWDTIGQFDFLVDVVKQIKKHTERISLFMNPVIVEIQKVKEIDADRIELYTGPYAADFSANPEKSIRQYVLAAEAALQSGLGINAGHDLNLDNLKFFKNNIANLAEVSIGHAIICDALIYGMENVIPLYLKQLQ